MSRKKTYLPAVCIVAVLVLSLIPVLAASIYTRPVTDDFTYGLFVRRAVEQEGNIFDVIKAACATVVEYYMTWQGTFTASFIFALQPGGFSYDLYFLTTVLMVSSLIGSTVYFCYTVIVRWIKATASDAIFISCVMLLFQIQFLPDKTQAFYWFNGSSYYTLFYSFSLVFYAMLIRLFLTENHKAVLTVMLTLLAFLISGGNYSTGLMTWIIVGLTGAWAIWRKQNRFEIVVVFFVFSFGFIINMIAPGNKVRAANLNGMDPLQAIGFALMAGLYYIKNWTSFPGILFLLAVGPLTYSMAKRTEFSFKYPLVVVVLLFGLYSSQNVPPYYAMSRPGAGRQFDIYYYSYYLTIWGMLFYSCGWLSHNRELSPSAKAFFVSKRNQISICYYVVLTLMVFAGVAFHYQEATSVQTASSLLSGEVQEYCRKMDEIFDILDSNSEVCYAPDVNDRPSFCTSFGHTTDADFWINTAMADYFHHDKVVLKTD